MRSIWVTFSKEGIHKYPAALNDPNLATGDEYDVSFLGYPHRHIFHFKVWIEVFHDDRDIEFIQFKRWLERLYAEVDSSTSVLQLDFKSCEMIADDLAVEIQNKYPDRYIKISVAEDNENGCEMEYHEPIKVEKPEGSWYEGGNPHKDDSQATYVKGLDD